MEAIWTQGKLDTALVDTRCRHIVKMVEVGRCNAIACAAYLSLLECLIILLLILQLKILGQLIVNEL